MPINASLARADPTRSRRSPPRALVLFPSCSELLRSGSDDARPGPAAGVAGQSRPAQRSDARPCHRASYPPGPRRQVAGSQGQVNPLMAEPQADFDIAAALHEAAQTVATIPQDFQTLVTQRLQGQVTSLAKRAERA